ncbi:hypothetical protein, partial [Bradyrhizobium sp. ERR14]|uniref:hypothetical protein n=1 Tax=Bradyrhizobium sp. ERR14 TaxID=2663837 RepID=UPI001AEF1455
MSLKDFIWLMRDGEEFLMVSTTACARSGDRCLIWSADTSIGSISSPLKNQQIRFRFGVSYWMSWGIDVGAAIAA